MPKAIQSASVSPIIGDYSLVALGNGQVDLRREQSLERRSLPVIFAYLFLSSPPMHSYPTLKMLTDVTGWDKSLHLLRIFGPTWVGRNHKIHQTCHCDFEVL